MRKRFKPDDVIIEIPEFITHVAVTNNKRKANKYVKINYQHLYNNNVSRFQRNAFVQNIKKTSYIFI